MTAPNPPRPLQRLLVAGILSLSLASAADAPAADRLWLTYGDFMSGFQSLPDMVKLQLDAADPKAPPLTRLALGVGAHGNTVEIWQSGVHTWITGAGKAAGTNWRDNPRSRKIAASLEGRKADLVMVQLDLSYVTDRRKSETLRAETDTAVAGYVATAKAAGAPLAFYVLPGSQHTTHHRGSKAKDAPPVPKTEDDHRPQLEAMEAEALRLTRTHGAVLAPTFRAFAALRAAHPEIDLHAPIRGDDTHLSPRDAALCALVIARAYLGDRFTAPDPEALLAPQNARLALDNAKRKAKGEAEQPLNTLDATTWSAMLEAVASAATAR